METKSLFAPFKDFLQHTLHSENTCPKSSSARRHSALFQLIDHGIVCTYPDIAPDNSSTTRSNEESEYEGGIVFSAGIHGDETAPIELLNILFQRIWDGEVTLKQPILLVFGNPEAMKKGQRFVSTNLNRLFLGSYKKTGLNTETSRAEQLEKALAKFESKFGIKLHLDLHTSIRPSHHERFALRPFSQNRTEVWKPNNEELALLSAFGITALVHQTKPSKTFSSHTLQKFHTSSFTFELGSARPFGQNDLKEYENCLRAMKALCSSESVKHDAEYNEVSEIEQYFVCTEILNSGKSFELNVDDQALNFTGFSKNTTVWSDQQKSYIVEGEEEYILFPNNKVPIGQRAGLLVKKMN